MIFCSISTSLKNIVGFGFINNQLEYDCTFRIAMNINNNTTTHVQQLYGKIHTQFDPLFGLF